MDTIGIGITTRNRPDVLEYVVRQFDKYCPQAIRIITIDDNSDDEDLNRRSAEQIGEYYWMERRLGVANAKNECIRRFCVEKELQVDHLFLFDDDCFPIREGWWKPWITSGENHLVFSPGKGVRKMKERSKEMAGGLGCCLYLTKRAIEVIGGFDPDFGIWGYEHTELSNRICLAKLTDWVYIAPLESGVYSFDFSGITEPREDFVWQSKSSITQEEKGRYAQENAVKFSKMINKMKAGDVWRDIWK